MSQAVFSAILLLALLGIMALVVWLYVRHYERHVKLARELFDEGDLDREMALADRVSRLPEFVDYCWKNQRLRVSMRRVQHR